MSHLVRSAHLFSFRSSDDPDARAGRGSTSEKKKVATKRIGRAITKKGTSPGPGKEKRKREKKSVLMVLRAEDDGYELVFDILLGIRNTVSRTEAKQLPELAQASEFKGRVVLACSLCPAISLMTACGSGHPRKVSVARLADDAGAFQPRLCFYRLCARRFSPHPQPVQH